MADEFRYLRDKRVKHIVTQSPIDGSWQSLCGVHPIPNWLWMGTGGQEEYERIEQLELCSRCDRKG
jgi:hypothetical protein